MKYEEIQVSLKLLMVFRYIVKFNFRVSDDMSEAKCTVPPSECVSVCWGVGVAQVDKVGEMKIL